MNYKKEKKRINKKWDAILKNHPNLEPLIKTYRDLDLGFLEKRKK